jgi:hypothetical protein
LIVNPLNPFANIGPVELGKEEQNNYRAMRVYPAFRNDLNTTEIAEIVNAINLGISFWLYYDLLSNEWKTSTTATPGLTNQIDQPFVYAPAITSGPNTEIYSDWPPYPAGGLLYVTIASDSETSTTTYELTARGRVYVFESYRDVRFFWEPNQVVIDSATGLALQDNIEIMPFVNTNMLVNNNEPVIVDPSQSFLKSQVTFNITGVFVQDDGYVDNSKVEVSLVDEDADGIPDDPAGFEKIITPEDRIVFELQTTELYGSQTTRPWIARWGTELQDETSTELFVYFPVNPLNPTALYSSPYIANQQLSGASILDPGSVVTAGFKYIYLDDADLVFINNIDQILFNNISLVKSISNQVTAFFNGPTTTDILPANYPWLAGTELVADKSDILTNYFTSKSFLIYAISPPGFGVYYSLVLDSSADLVSYPTGQIVIADIDPYRFDKNGKSFTQNTSVLELERLPLYFKWSHYSPIDQRVDPSPSNIIDMIVITDSYNRDVTIWKNNNGSSATFPAAPTTEDLRIQFQELNQYKMVSDSMIWNSGQFKILFGTQAEAELQATFKVVKAPSSSVSDNEVKTRVITAIDTYFDIRNWDFGEKFFYTELAAFIHQQLSRIISSVVIVPNNANSQFGNLFEIAAGPTELFLSTATVNNVQIVANLTDQNLRV